MLVGVLHVLRNSTGNQNLQLHRPQLHQGLGCLGEDELVRVRVGAKVRQQGLLLERVLSANLKMTRNTKKQAYMLKGPTPRRKTLPVVKTLSESTS